MLRIQLLRSRSGARVSENDFGRAVTAGVRAAPTNRISQAKVISAKVQKPQRKPSAPAMSGAPMAANDCPMFPAP